MGCCFVLTLKKKHKKEDVDINNSEQKIPNYISDCYKSGLCSVFTGQWVAVNLKKRSTELCCSFLGA